MTDPLGSGTLSDAVSDLQGLVTGTYVPVYITAMLAAIAIGVGLRWLNRGAKRVGSGK